MEVTSKKGQTLRWLAILGVATLAVCVKNASLLGAFLCEYLCVFLT
jgi:hypothetical protein